MTPHLLKPASRAASSTNILHRLRLNFVLLLGLAWGISLSAAAVEANDDPLQAAKKYVSDGILTVPGADVRLKIPPGGVASAKFPARPKPQDRLSCNLYPDIEIDEGRGADGGLLQFWTTGKKTSETPMKDHIENWAKVRSAQGMKMHKTEEWTNSNQVDFVVVTADAYREQRPVKFYYFVNSSGIMCYAYAKGGSDKIDELFRNSVDTMKLNQTAGD